MQRKPQLLALNQQANQVTLELLLNDNLEYFKGHFPNYPLLPGVTQIDWAIFYAQQYLAVPSQFAGMEVLKFQHPLRPNAQTRLHLEWHSEKHKLYFSYTSLDSNSQNISVTGCKPQLHSSGRISLK